MPVDEDINLDNPDGISEEEIAQMEAEADRLEKVSEQAEEAVKKFKRSTEGLNFAQLNILESGVATTRSQDSNGGVGSMSKEELVQLIVEMMETVKENKEKNEEQEKEIDDVKKQQEIAEKERKQLENEIKNDIRDGEGKFYESMNALNNPISFGQGKIMNFVRGAGIAGLVISIVWKFGEFLYKEIERSFSAGGANDIRKMVDDRTKEIAELDDMLARRNGRVFYSGDITLSQGIPQISYTERLRDQMIRYESLHLGE